MAEPQGFFTVRTEGGLLPAGFLQRLAQAATGGGNGLPGLTPDAYHLIGNERLNEAANHAWTRLLGAWAAYRKKLERTPKDDPATTVTREKWLLPLFQALDYGRLQTTDAGAFTVEGKSYPVSHGWGASPIHLLGSRVSLDTRTKGVAGAAQASPHSLVQELLNRSPQHLWAFLSNGHRLRILRDNLSLTRQAFVEFDLETMMEGEIYSDFLLLFLLCHESRVEGDRPEDCWLEKWTRLAQKQGTRALDSLRHGVEKAIGALGRGFLSHARNGALRESLRTGELDRQDYYRQLLRTVYRLIFLFVAEDRDLLLVPDAPDDAKERYRRHYSTDRLRRLAGRTRGGPHGDLWRVVALVAGKLAEPDGCPELAVPALGSHLWDPRETAALDGCELANRDLIEAVTSLAYIEDGKVRQRVDYKNLGPEELGSVYESLLELQPVMNVDAGTFALETVAGHERKTTGSYYTPTSLINVLLDSALDPVVEEATDPDDPEALLRLKVCDPACGSGHFLIAAAHRIAKKLAALRTGDDEPSPESVQHAVRDVIAHCIYGVDINPMALELCKVNLWLETLEPGRPLAFLDHHLQCGNSLLGATPRLLQEGIPDEAFKDLELDDHDVVLRFRSIHRKERKDRESGQAALFQEPWDRLGDLGNELLALDRVEDDSLEGIHEKERRWRGLLDSTPYLHSRLWADAWCAAFVWRKVEDDDHPTPITEAVFRKIEHNPNHVIPAMRDEIRRLANKYRFFHWHLAFPEVFQVPGPDEGAENEETGWNGGFDVVLGNPPWERVKLQEKEWFAARHKDIAEAPRASERRKLIEELKDDEHQAHLYEEFMEAKRFAEGWSHLLRDSGRYPLTGLGDVNTYQVFAGLNRSLLAGTGRAGFIIPTGIATDHTTREFFQDLMESRSLVSLYDFQSGPGLFAEIGHARFKFALVTLNGSQRQTEQAEFAFFLRNVAHLKDPERRFTLSAEDIALLNPNTQTCPIFKYRRDAEITKAMYRRVAVLIEEGEPERNPWGGDFLRMFDMANDSGLFRTREQLEEEGWRLVGNCYLQEDEAYLPLYEAKMVHHFNHRFGDYADRPKGSKSTSLPEVPVERLAEATYLPMPRYWVPSKEVEARLRERWNRGWLLGWRDICRSTDERTVIAGVIPGVGVGHKFPLFLPSEESVPQAPTLLGSLSSFVFDYCARQKIGGTSLTYFVLKQLPILEPGVARQPLGWSAQRVLNSWVAPYILELTYTAWDLQPFAKDCGYDGPPFRWDEDRRFLLRCELDAAFFHLYGVERDDVDYILETFLIVKRKDVQEHGDFRTKLVILDIYDRLQEAIDGGEPYRTLLDPPPGDALVAHPGKRGR